MHRESQEQLNLNTEGYLLVAEEIPYTGLAPTTSRSNPDHETQRLQAIELIKQYTPQIHDAARKYNVTPEAIAGAILWEALENPDNRPGFIRPNVPGKVHPINWDVLRPNQWINGVPLSAAEKVEREGRVPPLFASQYVPDGPLERAFSDILETGSPTTAVLARIERLREPQWAITYVAAIMDSHAEDYEKKAGVNVRNNTGVLTTFFHGGDNENRANDLGRRRQAVQQQNDREQREDKDGPPLPLPQPVVPEKEMGEWVNKNMRWVRDLLQEGAQRQQHVELQQDSVQVAQLDHPLLAHTADTPFHNLPTASLADPRWTKQVEQLLDDKLDLLKARYGIPPHVNGNQAVQQILEHPGGSQVLNDAVAQLSQRIPPPIQIASTTPVEQNRQTLPIFEFTHRSQHELRLIPVSLEHPILTELCQRNPELFTNILVSDANHVLMPISDQTWDAAKADPTQIALLHYGQQPIRTNRILELLDRAQATLQNNPDYNGTLKPVPTDVLGQTLVDNVIKQLHTDFQLASDQVRHGEYDRLPNWVTASRQMIEKYVPDTSHRNVNPTELTQTASVPSTNITLPAASDRQPTLVASAEPMVIIEPTQPPPTQSRVNTQHLSISELFNNTRRLDNLLGTAAQLIHLTPRELLEQEELLKQQQANVPPLDQPLGTADQLAQRKQQLVHDLAECSQNLKAAENHLSHLQLISKVPLLGQLAGSTPHARGEAVAEVMNLQHERQQLMGQLRTVENQWKTAHEQEKAYRKWEFTEDAQRHLQFAQEMNNPAVQQRLGQINADLQSFTAWMAAIDALDLSSERQNFAEGILEGYALGQGIPPEAQENMQRDIAAHDAQLVAEAAAKEAAKVSEPQIQRTIPS